MLAIPVALTLGSTVRKDADAIRDHSRLTAVEANVVPPYDYGASENDRTEDTDPGEEMRPL